MEPVLELAALEVSLTRAKRTWPVVRQVSFRIAPSEVLCLVGESGCGKSMTALAIARLLPSPPAKITGGHVFFEGQDLATLSFHALRRVRGRDIGVVFQDPMSALNPVQTVYQQLAEALLIHQALSRHDVNQRIDLALEEVGISSQSGKREAYPHELSGGLRQRVMIAMALINHPRLLIADEPTTALDVTIQAQVLDLLKDLQQKRQMSMLFITHDLGVVDEMANRVAVMYAGQVLELAPREELFIKPRHPYTQALAQVMPSLRPIPGQVPNLADLPAHCAFAQRCPHVTQACRESIPELRELSPGHFVRCIHA